MNKYVSGFRYQVLGLLKFYNDTKTQHLIPNTLNFPTMQKTKLFFFVAVLFLAACGTSKKASTVNTKPILKDLSKMSVQDIISSNDRQQITAQWLSGNAGLDYKGKPISVSASSNIIWRRDSLIYLSIKKLGFSVAKAKVTHDSVFIINQLQGTRISEPLSYIETHFGIPGDFNMIQKILLGQPVFLVDKKNLTSIYNNDTQTLTLSGSDEKRNAVYVFDATNFQLKSMNIEEPGSTRSIDITNDNVDSLGNAKFSYLRTISINSPQTGNARIVIDVDNKNIEVDVPKNIKF